MFDRKKDYLMRRADRNHSIKDYYSHTPSRHVKYSGYGTMYRDERGMHHEPYVDYHEDYRSYPENDYRDYKDYRGNYDYRSDYRNDYGMDYDREYHEDLKKWITQLQKKDRFKINMEQVIKRAKEMGIDFKDYDEEEFYAVYLMHLSDYPKISNDYNSYIEMTKAYFDDDDIAVTPSEKLCKYYYSIVLGEE